MYAKRIMFILAAALIFLTGGLVTAKQVLADSHGEPMILNWAHILNKSQDDFGVGVDKHFADEVFKRTEGAVKMKIFWGQSLGKAIELLDLVKSGSVDMISLYVAVNTSSFPLWSAPCGMPFTIENLDQGYQMTVQMPQKLDGLKREFKHNNVKLFFHHLFENYQLFASEPLTSFSDLKGKRIRSLGKYSPVAYEAAGAVGVDVVFSDLYTGLQRGVIDGMFAAPLMARFFKTYEVSKVVSEWNFGVVVAYGNWINLDKWNRISAKNQKIILDIAVECQKMELERAKRVKVETRKFLTDKGVVFHKVSASERNKWKSASPDYLNVWVDSMPNATLKSDAKEMKKMWLKIQEEY